VIHTTNLASFIGADVLDSAGTKIGTVAQIFVHPTDGHPRWVLIKHGLGHDWIAPLEDAVSDVDAITVPYEKSFIKKAPISNAADGLTTHQEAALEEYFDRAATAAPQNPGRHAQPVEG